LRYTKYSVRSLGVGFVVAAGALLGQAPAVTPAFEVAAIRAAPSMTDFIQQFQAGKAKIGMTIDGSRVDVGFSSLADLIRIAYRVKTYQVQGPDWMAQQRFEIQAKIPDGVSEDKVPEMLQSLLAERFKLTIHRDKKELPVYALIVGKSGPKLTEASAKPDDPIPDSPGRGMTIGTEKGQMKIVQDGKGGAVMQGAGQAGTTRIAMVNGAVHLEMTKVTLASLADTLAPLVDRPVLDLTELKGTYQMALDLPIEDLQILAQKQAATLGIPSPSPPPSANPADLASTPGGSAIFSAIEKLGLKLDARKAPVETIVVDHLEKTPTAN
jgi:uncharacterized protein (TIGR03435 family)